MVREQRITCPIVICSTFLPLNLRSRVILFCLKIKLQKRHLIGDLSSCLWIYLYLTGRYSCFLTIYTVQAITVVEITKKNYSCKPNFDILVNFYFQNCILFKINSFFLQHFFLIFQYNSNNNTFFAKLTIITICSCRVNSLYRLKLENLIISLIHFNFFKNSVSQI